LTNDGLLDSAAAGTHAEWMETVDRNYGSLRFWK